eukprot:scaffold14793_cov37-Tisochrysis_lutea.AAC.3
MMQDGSKPVCTGCIVVEQCIHGRIVCAEVFIHVGARGPHSLHPSRAVGQEPPTPLPYLVLMACPGPES